MMPGHGWHTIAVLSHGTACLLGTLTLPQLSQLSAHFIERGCNVICHTKTMRTAAPQLFLRRRCWRRGEGLEPVIVSNDWLPAPYHNVGC